MGIHRGWKKTEICHIEEKCYFNERREMKEGGIDGSMWDCFNAEAQRRGGIMQNEPLRLCVKISN